MQAYVRNVFPLDHTRYGKTAYPRYVVLGDWWEGYPLAIGATEHPEELFHRIERYTDGALRFTTAQGVEPAIMPLVVPGEHPAGYVTACGAILSLVRHSDDTRTGEACDVCARRAGPPPAHLEVA